jgi:hypothetical protein
MIKDREWGWLWVAPGTLCTGTPEDVYPTRRIDSVCETSARNVQCDCKPETKVRSPSSPKNGAQPVLLLSLAAVLLASAIEGCKLANFGLNWVTEVSFRFGNPQPRVEHDSNEWLMP